jgi:hypothetical protein
VRGPIASLLLHGKKLDLALGADVILGRTEGTLTVPSQAVSRQHLRIARDDTGHPFVEDVGSRNGTELRGMRIAGPLPVGAGIELRLGGEVPIRLAPSAEIEGAVAIDVGGVRHVAPLGPARLGVGAWHIEPASDGWLELVTAERPPAIAANVLLVARVTLLAGDAFAKERGAEPVVRILGGA